jgi:hypothetical protein
MGEEELEEIKEDMRIRGKREEYDEVVEEVAEAIRKASPPLFSPPPPLFSVAVKN